MLISPCNKCKDRKVSFVDGVPFRCHDHCPKYKAFATSREIEKRHRKEAEDAELSMDNYIRSKKRKRPEF